MKKLSRFVIGSIGLLCWINGANGVDRFVSPLGSHQPPFTSWETAATNIQAAIDAASAGDVIWVTNGVYDTGGRVMTGDLTNRVALYKPVTVRSVNGPLVTIIRGAGATNGPAAVRCAWLTNGAALIGFTLEGGATRSTGALMQDDVITGGGVRCWPFAGPTGSPPKGIVANCIIRSNTAIHGAGAYEGTLMNCIVYGNTASSHGGGAYAASLTNCLVYSNTASMGGGAYNCTLVNCVVKDNYATSEGGGTYSSFLRNCAVKGNSARSRAGGCSYGTLINCTVTKNWAQYGAGGVAFATLTNCIVYANWTDYGLQSQRNYHSSTIAFTCTTPLPAGPGNIDAHPQLLKDDVHIAATSPCRRAGTNVASGTDIDGQSWANPPSMGCDEWQPEPLIVRQPLLQPLHKAFGFTADVVVAGQEPFTCWWTKDGVPIEDNDRYSSARTTTLVAAGIYESDVGNYQVVVSNAFGVATSSVTRLTLHYADAANVTPLPPYSSWSTAATNIQDAIDVAGEGAFILVTNGVYATGGKVMAGDLTNRIAVDKPVAVIGVNGPEATIIEGAWDPVTTNGPGAVRCAWLADGATLYGFTLRGGATRAAGGGTGLWDGGGVWCASTNASLVNCVIISNAAYGYGGGCYGGTLINCRVLDNWARLQGGGVYNAMLRNCLLRGNFAALMEGGGAYRSVLVNCTVCENRTFAQGAGICASEAFNCIVYNNNPDRAPHPTHNWWASTLSYSCTTPLPPGPGNITNAPQLIDGVHLAVTSPCRGAGSPLYASGTDIDGEPWSDPPSMGCDEVWEEAIKGPLAVSAEVRFPPAGFEIAERVKVLLVGTITGRASRVAWSFGDGSVLTNSSELYVERAWTNSGSYNVTFTAYNADYPDGVSTNLLVEVVPLRVPVLSTSGMRSNQFQLAFDTQWGVSYVVEYATNLVPPVLWHTLRTTTGLGTPAEVWDASPTNEARFYRTRIQ